MKILIRNSDNLVIYADDSIVLSDKAQSNSWVDFNFNTTNATIAEAELPSLWSGAVWSYTNGAWTVVDTDRYAQLIEEDILSKVPKTVTPRQARLALLQATLLDEVELLLANDKAMQIWWEYSLDIQRNHEHITAMGLALGLTPLQLDDLFVLAGTL